MAVSGETGFVSRCGRYAGESETVSSALVKRHVNNVLHTAGEGWGVADLAANGLTEILGTAREHLARKDLASAIEIAAAVAEGLIGNYGEFMDEASQAFYVSPSLKLYKEIRGTAKKLKTWPDVSLRLIEFLDGKKQFDLLTRIRLFEKEFDLVLEALKKYQSNRRWQPGGEDHLEIEVAEFHGKNGWNDRWTSFISGLREGSKRLPALIDELNKANLKSFTDFILSANSAFFEDRE